MYTVVRGCQWCEFCTYGKEGELVAVEGLPAEVLDYFVRCGNLVPVMESAA